MKSRKTFPILSVLGIWLLLAVFANINGALRVYLIIPFVGEKAGHVISCFTFSAIIFAVSYVYVSKKRIDEKKTLILIGLLWLCMTIAFEFLFGHYVFNNSWDKLLNDYNISAGRLWVIVLVATLMSPAISGAILKNKQHHVEK